MRCPNPGCNRVMVLEDGQFYVCKFGCGASVPREMTKMRKEIKKEKEYMNFDEYQKLATTTAVYPRIGSNIYYPALGLGGESGEVCDKISKVMRDFNDKVTEEMKAALEKELGDVLWYLAQLATELGLSLDEIAKNNIKKLQVRKERNKLHGSGDDR